MYGTHGILSMNKGIAAPIMTAMEDTMNNILRVCWFIFIVCVIVLFFIFLNIFLKTYLFSFIKSVLVQNFSIFLLYLLFKK